MRVIDRAASKFLTDVAFIAVGAAWLTPELRVQLAEAWRWVLEPEHVAGFDRWLQQRNGVA